MISDVERRDAADFLKCYADKTGFKASCVIAATVGIKCEKTDGDAMCEECWAKAATRLADLIEPQPTCRFYDPEEGMCLNVRTARPCDRDALLALADEIDRKSNDGTTNPDPMRPLATSLDLFGYARRIREALGAVE